LKQLSSRRKTAQALALRARIVLECAQGLENQEVAAGLGVANNTVGKWRRRFVERRIDGLHDEPRSGEPRSKSQIQALDRSQPMLAERTFCSAGATKLKVDDGAMSLAYLRTITVRGIASLSACCLRSLAIGPELELPTLPYPTAWCLPVRRGRQTRIVVNAGFVPCHARCYELTIGAFKEAEIAHPIDLFLRQLDDLARTKHLDLLCENIGVHYHAVLFIHSRADDLLLPKRRERMARPKRFELLTPRFVVRKSSLI